MLRHLRRFIFGVVVSALVGSIGSARAQNNGFQISRLEPTAAGEWSFAVDHPWYSKTRYFAAGVTLNYAHNPLLFGRPGGENGFSETLSIIEHQFIGHVDLAGSFLDRVLITASLPIVFLERGNAVPGVGPSDSVTVGDPRVGIMVRLYGQPYSGPISISLGGYIWVPLRKFTDSLPAQESDQEVRGLPKLVLGGLTHSFFWSFTVGVLIRPEATIGMIYVPTGSTAGTEIQFGAAVAYANTRLRLSVGPEFIFATGLYGTSRIDATSMEGLLGLHYNIARLFQLSVGGGIGLLRQPGTPDGRALLRFAYAPMAAPKEPPKDRDHDGIIDTEDACADEPGPRRADPELSGCPDRDGDSVIDRDDLCPDEPKGGHPDAHKLGCPLHDRDADGVLDAQDVCPDEPKGDHPDAHKLGCPTRDRDGDGVFDDQDQCPEEAKGDHPDARKLGCPLHDRDGDGVFDYDDLCPDGHKGPTPDPQRLGCPAGDRDHDTVADPVDACPDKPGAPDPDPKRNGCPGLVEIKGGQIVIVKPVFFATNKDIILKKSFPVLQSVADALKASPQIKKVRVEGHTDDRGKVDHNIDLSGRRAKSVVAWLIEHRIAAGRLTAEGYGPKRPVADNGSSAGRAKNRRVDFVIIDPPQDASIQSVNARDAVVPDSPDQSDRSAKRKRGSKADKAERKSHHRHRSKTSATETDKSAESSKAAEGDKPEGKHHRRHHHKSAKE